MVLFPVFLLLFFFVNQRYACKTRPGVFFCSACVKDFARKNRDFLKQIKYSKSLLQENARFSVKKSLEPMLLRKTCPSLENYAAHAEQKKTPCSVCFSPRALPGPSLTHSLTLGSSVEPQFEAKSSFLREKHRTRRAKKTEKQASQKQKKHAEKKHKYFEHPHPKAVIDQEM